MTDVTSLIAQHSQGVLVLDGRNASLRFGPPPGSGILHKVTQGVALGSRSALFRVEHLADETYRVVSELTGMVFDVARASQESGAPIILWPWHGGANQRFRLKKPPVNNKAWGFYLEAKHSGKVLDVFRASQESDAPLVQWDFHGGPNQLFRVFDNPIRPVYSDLVLDVVNGSQANGAPIILWPLHGRPNQLFRLEHVPNAPTGQQGERTTNAYRIVANHGKVLEVEGASHENGAKLIQWDWHGGPNQLFIFHRSPIGGEFILSALHSRKVIDVARASGDPGAQIIQWRSHGGPNQHFIL